MTSELEKFIIKKYEAGLEAVDIADMTGWDFESIVSVITGYILKEYHGIEEEYDEV